MEEMKERVLWLQQQSKDIIIEKSPTKRFIKFNQLIGTGSYKMVYRAYDHQTGLDVAWVSVQLSSLPLSQRKRLVDQISILKNLSHPNIIGFVTQWANRPLNEVVFITQMLNAGSLKHHLRRIRNPRLKIIKGWVKDILKGLQYLHSKSIIHRDIKCDNIFLNSTKNQVMIGDLGLACAQQGSVTALGTPQFMAPETLKYQVKVTPAIDIWALGLCTLQMITLSTPYHQCSCVQDVVKTVRKGIRPNNLNKIKNKQVKSFIESMIAINPLQRPTASQLLNFSFLNDIKQQDEIPVQLEIMQKQVQPIKSICSMQKLSFRQASVSSQQSITSMLQNRKSLFKQMYLQYRQKSGHPQSQNQLIQQLIFQRKILNILQQQIREQYQMRKSPCISTEVSKTLKVQYGSQLIEMIRTKDLSQQDKDYDKLLQKTIDFILDQAFSQDTLNSKMDKVKGKLGVYSTSISKQFWDKALGYIQSKAQKDRDKNQFSKI